MDKTLLLTEAAKSFWISPKLLAFAQKPLTEEEANNRHNAASASAQRWERSTHLVTAFAFLFGFLVGVCAIIMNFAISGETEFTPALGLLVLLICVFFGMLGLIAAIVLMAICRFCAGYQQDYCYLAPLAGSRLCEQGLQDLENGGPSVRAWRDLALQERSQLRVLDYHVMAALRRLYEASKIADAEKERLAAACRALHGLPNPELPRPL